MLPFTVMPGGPGVYGFRSSFSMIVVYAFLSLAPLTVLVMGWSSANKFSMIGAGREALVTVSGELTLVLALLSAASMYGTLDLVTAAERQAASHVPGLVADPLAAFVFFASMLLLSDRIPFDLVLGEQEIVQGPYTEYSGLLYALTMAVDYVKLYGLSMLFSILFLGGWAPFGSPLLGSAALYAKALAVMLFSVFLRSVYGRIRLDQVLESFWSRLIPIGFAALALGVFAHLLYAG
jgi:NADH-quinone oxidoreductase subunit H